MIYEKNNCHLILDDNRHLELIKKVIAMYNEGINVDVFDKFTHNINNLFKNFHDPDRSKTLEEWEKYLSQFSPKDIEIKQNQIELIFKYLQIIKGSDINIKKEKYHSTLERSHLKEGYKLEYLVLKTLEVNEKYKQ